MLASQIGLASLFFNQYETLYYYLDCYLLSFVSFDKGNAGAITNNIPNR